MKFRKHTTYYLLLVAFWVIIGVYLHELFEDWSFAMNVAVSFVLVFVVTVLVLFIARVTGHELDMNIPHRYWLPNKTITMNFTGEASDLITYIVKEISKDASWTVTSVDALNGTLDLSTRAIVSVLVNSTIKTKHVRVVCDKIKHQVTVTSNSQENKKGLFYELVDFGKDYHNVEYIKRIIESSEDGGINKFGRAQKTG